jgi:hypothetical protein
MSSIGIHGGVSSGGGGGGDASAANQLIQIGFETSIDGKLPDDGLSASGALGALNAAVTLALAGNTSAIVYCPIGTLDADIIFEASVDGGTVYLPIWASQISVASLPLWVQSVSSFLLPGLFIIPCAGCTHIRVRVSVYNSGTATAIVRASGIGTNYVVQPPRNKLNADWIRITGAAGSGTVDIATSDPAASANGLVVRNIPVIIPTTSVTTTSVNDNAASVTLLASNTLRRFCTIYNDSSATLYVRLSSLAASTTTYNAQLPTGGYLEVPGNYTGAITGIWASDPNDGAARIGEFFE